VSVGFAWVPALRRTPGFVLAMVTCASVLVAQEKRPLELNDPAWGRIVHHIHISPPTADRDRMLGMLKTKKDAILTNANITEDLVKIYVIHRIRAQVFVSDVDDKRIELYFEMPPVLKYDRHAFKGMEHLTETEVRRITGLRASQRVHEDDAERVRLVIRERYRRDGFYFASVETRADEVAKLLTFYVDEGPRVYIGKLRFRGNKSFPGSTLLGFGENLEGSAKLESVGGVFNKPFSIWNVQEDVKKLELFYRRNGYLDAEVHQEEMRLNEARDEVDLTFRVVEGERYKVVAVELEQHRTDNPADARPPRYDKGDVIQEIKLAPGDYFSSVLIKRDRDALERYYGKRGHPTSRRYGQPTPNLFRVLEPHYVFDEVKPELTVIYQLIEGEPKTLREVRIHGNTTTQGRVIRRRVLLLPGDGMDVTKLDRSRDLLDRTRYFVDPDTLSLTRFELSPVVGDDKLVDLDIFVKEGETGQFTWGVGVSSGTGVRGNFQFQKRNFDISKLPSSWNPGTWISEIAEGKAFHGADQNLDLLLAPGTEFSYYRVSVFDPDIFRQHMDTIGARVDLYKSIRILDSFNVDRLGGAITMSRIFNETNRVNLTVRDEKVKLRNIEPNAPTIVWQSQGKTEIRGLKLSFALSDLDHTLHPREGYNFTTSGELVGGPIGGGQDFYKLGLSGEFYRPFHTDALERKHVLYSRVRVDHAEAFGSSPFVYPSERFYMGGSNLRGFDQRRAGPSQFGQPVGGESRLLSTVEYQFPLVSTQMEGTTRHTEIIRGVIFSDYGMLGLNFNDSIYREPRLTVGFGIRIQVPVLQVPIQLDLGWPILGQDSDREEQLFFSFRRF
jgi:outer membrane protein insertion porin family